MSETLPTTTVAEEDFQGLLHRLAGNRSGDALETLVMVVDWLRPKTPENKGWAEGRMNYLTIALESSDLLPPPVLDGLRHWLGKTQFFNAFAGLGVFSRRGFVREFAERCHEHISPTPPAHNYLRDILPLVFHQETDPRWVASVSDESWSRLFLAVRRALVLPGRPDPALTPIEAALYAMEMLSIWGAAEELEPELMRLDPELSQSDSAFVALQREIALYVEQARARLNQPDLPESDDSHARVLLDQCREQLARFRKKILTRGTTISLAHLLERLDQTFTRIEDLLDVLSLDPAVGGAARGRLFKRLVQASSERHSPRLLWQRNVRLLARNITESASNHGEHYITRDGREYLAMLRSAAGAGVLIALMALLKLWIVELPLKPVAETFLVSLNYGLGFVFIHMLHFTVATKQPAMTAACFAGAVEREEQGRANQKKLAALLIQVCRSQFAAVVGNVSVAVAVALLVGGLYRHLTGRSLLAEEAVVYQLHVLHPLLSLALFHAAIAGVWLFFSGLVAGFYDNRAAYLDVRRRLRRNPLLTALLSPERQGRLADYVHDNYGALAGNFIFGLLLGVTGYVGSLLSLPLDIRHIAFSSANLGYVMSGDELSPAAFLLNLAFVLLIGMINLLVSFFLALWVALKSRSTRMGRLSALWRAFYDRVREDPLVLVLPPRVLSQIKTGEDPMK
nr:site-specific recombinase [Desulfuromonas acetexigens]